MLLELSSECFERDNRCSFQVSNLSKTTREARWGWYAGRRRP
jgi:hypothetical protein